MSEILGLIERLEKATGPSRELDLEIARLQGVTVMRRNDDDTANIEHTYWNYTASLDAALTLDVPGANCHGYEADPKGIIAYVSRNHVPSGHWLYEGEHKTSPAIATCIARLKSRSPGVPHGTKKET